MKYILKNKNFNTYLCYRYGRKRYLVYPELAKKFSKKEVEKALLKFNHPENWEILEVKG